MSVDYAFMWYGAEMLGCLAAGVFVDQWRRARPASGTSAEPLVCGAAALVAGAACVAAAAAPRPLADESHYLLNAVGVIAAAVGAVETAAALLVAAWCEPGQYGRVFGVLMVGAALAQLLFVNAFARPLADAVGGHESKFLGLDSVKRGGWVPTLAIEAALCFLCVFAAVELHRHHRAADLDGEMRKPLVPKESATAAAAASPRERAASDVELRRTARPPPRPATGASSARAAISSELGTAASEGGGFLV